MCFGILYQRFLRERTGHLRQLTVSPPFILISFCLRTFPPVINPGSFLPPKSLSRIRRQRQAALLSFSLKSPSIKKQIYSLCKLNTSLLIRTTWEDGRGGDPKRRTTEQRALRGKCVYNYYYLNTHLAGYAWQSVHCLLRKKEKLGIASKSQTERLKPIIRLVKPSGLRNNSVASHKTDTHIHTQKFWKVKVENEFELFCTDCKVPAVLCQFSCLPISYLKPKSKGWRTYGRQNI